MATDSRSSDANPFRRRNERVNLTTCLGASLVNTLFCHGRTYCRSAPRDTGRLVDIMQALRAKGNTLVVVEHEEAVIRRADHIVDIGPGRGSDGGRLMFSGPAAEFKIRSAEFLRLLPNIFREESHPGACAPPQGERKC